MEDVGAVQGRGGQTRLPGYPRSPSLFPTQINVLYNRISHAQKL